MAGKMPFKRVNAKSFRAQASKASKKNPLLQTSFLIFVHFASFARHLGVRFRRGFQLRNAGQNGRLFADL